MTNADLWRLVKASLSPLEEASPACTRFVSRGTEPTDLERIGVAVYSKRIIPSKYSSNLQSTLSASSNGLCKFRASIQLLPSEKMACNPPIKTTRLLKCLQCEHSSRIEGQKVHTQLHTFVEVTLIAGQLNGSHQLVQFGALWVCCIGWRLKHRGKLLIKQERKTITLAPSHPPFQDPPIHLGSNDLLQIYKILILCQSVQSICIANRSFRTICHKPEFGNTNYQINLEHALLLRHSNPRKLTRLLCGIHHLSSLGTHVLRFPPENLQNLQKCYDEQAFSYWKHSNLLGRLLFPRGRQSGCLEDSSAVPPTASTTPASGGAAERRLLFHRSALRVTKVSPGDVGRRIRRVVRRCALFLLTSLLFAVSMNVFFNSIKWFLHLPQNATTVNATMELDEVVDSPALLIYLLNCAFIIFIPFSLVIAICLERRAENLLGLFTAYVIQLTEGHATWSVLLCRSFGLNTLWTLNLYCIARSLRSISVTDMTLLVCVLPPYGYLFSWILVPKKFVAFRIVALILASCGMLFLTYFDPNNIGSKIIAICGVVLQALFATIRRNLVGDITVSRVTAFYGFLGLTHTLLTWPLFVTTSVLTSFEPISWGHFPWLPFLVFTISAA
uniref:Solute carrier family 35 member F3 n=1 Tax=Echinococcus canadensis TaxID=519352 RepID=A0A915EU69_9CEST